MNWKSTLWKTWAICLSGASYVTVFLWMWVIPRFKEIYSALFVKPEEHLHFVVKVILRIGDMCHRFLPAFIAILLLMWIATSRYLLKSRSASARRVVWVACVVVPAAVVLLSFFVMTLQVMGPSTLIEKPR